MDTLTGRTTYVLEECCSCHVTFYVTKDFHQEKLDHRHERRGTFYCPNGHSQHYLGQTDVEKERERTRREREWRERAEAREVHLRDQLEAERRSNAARKGWITRARRRTGHGVCPVAGCKRHFPNLARHMATVHPEHVLDADQADPPAEGFTCTCGRTFDTAHGLAIHRGHTHR